MKSLPHISLLRGPYFGAFEAQNFEPLLRRFDIRAYILSQNPFDLNGCKVPVTVCRFLDSRLIGNRSLINAWRSRVLGHKYPMPGIDTIVRNSSVVHTFEAWYAFTRQAAEACNRHGIPMVVTHWDTQPYSNDTRGQLLSTYDSASVIIAPSDAARNALLEMGVKASKIVRLGMGVDADRFSPAPRDIELLEKLDFDPGDFVFLYIGRLAPEKGLPLLIEAFQRLQIPECRLLLIGSGPEKPKLDLGPNVRLIPAVAYNEVHRWHRLADAFVYPSLTTGTAQEQFGYSLVEAMSSGKAVIATRVGGMPDVVGDAGLLIPQEDVVALSEAMARLYTDKELRLNLEKAARARVLEKYSTAVVSKRLAEIYERSARSRAASG